MITLSAALHQQYKFVIKIVSLDLTSRLNTGNHSEIVGNLTDSHLNSENIAMHRQSHTWGMLCQGQAQVLHPTDTVGCNYLSLDTCFWYDTPQFYFQVMLNTLRPRQNGRHFADDIFKCIFLNQNVWISSKISLKFVLKGPINNIPALVQIMAWRRPGDKPLSEPMMVNLPTHICVSRPQWVNADSRFWLIHDCDTYLTYYVISIKECHWRRHNGDPDRQLLPMTSRYYRVSLCYTMILNRLQCLSCGTYRFSRG